MPTWPVSQRRIEKWHSQLQFQAPPIIINPGAGWTSKQWSPDRFASFAKAVWQKHRVESLVVWGGSAEEKIAKVIVEKAGRGTKLAPATTLQDLGELCRKARLFISGDTGPLHLAAAIGTPCVGLFGPVPAARNGPYGKEHIVIEPPSAVRPHWKDRKTDTESMAAITVEQVLAAVEPGLSRTNAA
jgi:ADP-heptose:LPS heptosyltransferase